MFKYFATITCILGVVIFGTEAIYRFRSDNGITDPAYITQSNVVISMASITIILSAHIVKMTEFISVKAMRLIALISIGLLCISVALRSKYKFFMPFQESTYNMYNATSFFICITIICWIPFFTYKKSIDRQETSLFTATHEIIRRRNEERRNMQQREYNADANYNHGSRQEEETLPSYYELPAPPIYTKTEVTAENCQSNESSLQNDRTANSPVNLPITDSDHSPPILGASCTVVANGHVSIDIADLHQPSNIDRPIIMSIPNRDIPRNS